MMQFENEKWQEMENGASDFFACAVLGPFCFKLKASDVTLFKNIMN